MDTTTSDYIRSKLTERFAEAYKIDFNEMKDLLEDEKLKVHKKFNELCDRMGNDKEQFDLYFARGFKDIKGSSWIYESFKEICRGIYNINPCARRKYVRNLDSEIWSFSKIISEAIESKRHFDHGLSSM